MINAAVYAGFIDLRDFPSDRFRAIFRSGANDRFEPGNWPPAGPPRAKHLVGRGPVGVLAPSEKRLLRTERLGLALRTALCGAKRRGPTNGRCRQPSGSSTAARAARRQFLWAGHELTERRGRKNRSQADIRRKGPAPASSASATGRRAFSGSMQAPTLSMRFPVGVGVTGSGWPIARRPYVTKLNINGKQYSVELPDDTPLFATT